jgi:hypothetical protein
MYFYSKNNQQEGPFTFEEIKTKEIHKTTLVWKEGMKEWVSADNLEELKELFFKLPPPLPNKDILEIKPKKAILQGYNQIKHDEQVNYSGLTTGIILMGLSILYAFYFKNDEIPSSEIYAYFAIFSLLTRIISMVVVFYISKDKNLNKTIWLCASFFFPSITLIIIGLVKKSTFGLNQKLPEQQKVALLLERASKLVSTNNIEAEQLILNALEIRPNSIPCLVFLSQIYLKEKKYHEVISNLINITNNTSYISDVSYLIGISKLKLGNFDDACNYLSTASKTGNLEASSALEKYYNFRGKFILDKKSAKLKLVDISDGHQLGYFLHGLNVEGLSSSKNKDLYQNYLGLFLKVDSNNFLAIQYSEIIDVINKGDSTINVKLFNGDEFDFKFIRKAEVIKLVYRVNKITCRVCKLQIN